MPGWYPRYHPGSRAVVRPCACRASRALSTGGRLGALPAAGVTVGQFGRSYWRRQVGVGPRDNCLTTFGRRLGSDIRSGPGARSHHTGLAQPGVLTATRLRLCLYIDKCMSLHREVPRAGYPSWVVCVEPATGERAKRACAAGQPGVEWRKLKLRRESSLDPGSFNGRTEDFESSNPGSNPGPGAIKPLQISSYVLISARFILN